MRNGWLPDKKDRDLKGLNRVSVGVLNYIPELAGYHSEGLDVLKLSLASIRAHADRDFDLVVVDNASCEPVRDFLRKEQAEGRIQVLILNQRNVGMHGMLQIFGAAPGEFIFFSDWDIYHRPGYMKAHLDIAESFPNVGIVGGRPLRHAVSLYTEGARRWLDEEDHGVSVEEGHFIPDEWLVEYAVSIGGYVDELPPKEAVAKWTREYEDLRLTKDGACAYFGASHMQFLISRKTIRELPQVWHATKFGKQKLLDFPLNELEKLRLSTVEPFVDHIGNCIGEERLRQAYRKLVLGDHSSTTHEPHAENAKINEWVWGNPVMRRVLLRVYNWSFHKYAKGSENRS